MAPTIEQIGKYKVVDVLGKGGMGVVYKAEDTRIGRMVAIKMMTGAFAENPDLLQRFYREAQSTGILQHPNIVIVHDLGDLDGSPYLVMEYLEGEALDKQIAARRQMSLVEKLGIIIQTLNGLHYAHERNIVHRDVKPANVMVLREGSVKIVDFGIARLGDNTLTRTGQVVGTISYMSPEQISAKLVDRRTDIFSCGVMLYELLTFQLPFDAPDTASTLLKIVNEAAPPISTHLQGTPPELEEVLQRALAKDRDERYSTAEDFAFDLSRVQEKLKRQLIDEHVGQAKNLVARSELPKAKELLLQVLRLESHHSVAKDLLAEVQQLLQKQQRSEQVRQLRSHAELAFSQQAFAEALSSLDQAVSLDKTNAELLNFRNLVQQAKQRKEQAEEALRRAESAHQVGDLEAAIKVLDEALQRDPSHPQMKSMHAAISAELAEQKHQEQVQGLLDKARRDISSRKFSQAFEILNEVKSIDASSPELHALLNLATSGRETERKRRELQQFVSEIEDALAADDLKTAADKAEAGLQRFPSDPGLLKLKALAAKQREQGERKRFIEEQTAAARKLLDSGKPKEALAVLERASQRVPGDPRLQSVLAIVRDSAERQEVEERKSKIIQEAKDALRRKQFDVAIKILETAHAEMENVEITDLLQFARDEAQQSVNRQKVDAAAEESQRLLSEGEYEQAMAVLQSALREAPDDELSLLLTQAQRNVDDEKKKIETALGRAKRLVESRKFDEAVAFLESQPKIYARSVQFMEALENARGEQEKLQAIVSATERARAACERGDFKAALGIVQSCRSTYGEAPEIAKATTEIEGKRSAIAKSAVERAIRDARTLLLARQYGAVLKSLDAVAEWVGVVTPDLKTQCETLRKDASSALERQQKGAELDKKVTAETTNASSATIIAGSYETPVPLAPPPKPAAPPPRPAMQVGGETTVFAGPPVAASRPAVAPTAPAPAPVARPVAVAPRKNMALIAGAVGAVLLVVGIIAYQKLSGPPPATTYVEVNAVPWGTVKYLEAVKGGYRIDVNQPTPLRVAVPAGDYKIVIAGPDGAERTDEIKATNDIPGSYSTVFEQIDVESILKSH
jgi:serine/threonine protein kinase